MNRRELIAGLLSAAYPNTSVSKLTYMLIEEVTADIDDQLLRAAIMLHISRSQYFPRPSEIRRAAYEIKANELEAPTAYGAWEEVRKAVVDHGRRKAPEFSHPRIAAAVRVLGWANICMSTNLIAERARFIQCYESIQNRDETNAIVLPKILDLARTLSAGPERKSLGRGHRNPRTPRRRG